MSERAATEASTPWRVASGVLVRAWDGEVVAYSDVTGHTHHFMEVAAWLFEQLSSRAMAETEIMVAAERELEPQEGGDISKSLRDSLVLLQGLGLIDRALAA